jgi:hypothetical protein
VAEDEAARAEDLGARALIRRPAGLRFKVEIHFSPETDALDGLHRNPR